MLQLPFIDDPGTSICPWGLLETTGISFSALMVFLEPTYLRRGRHLSDYRPPSCWSMKRWKENETI